MGRGWLGAKHLAEYLDLPLLGVDGFTACAFALLLLGGAYAAQKLDMASMRAELSSLAENPWLLAGVVVNAATFTASAQKVRKAAKVFIFVVSLPQRIHALYSSWKRPVQWRTRMLMSTMSSSLMSYFCKVRKGCSMEKSSCEYTGTSGTSGGEGYLPAGYAVCSHDCVVLVEVRVDHNVQQVHLFGDARFVGIGTFAHVL